MTWFLKKNSGVEYGPTDLETLRAWAADGRVAPDDRISRDGETWAPAPDEVLLEIEWVIAAAEGEVGGPFHLNAYVEWLRDGTLPPETVIRSLRTGKQGTLHEFFGEAVPLDVPAAAPTPAAVEPSAMPVPERASWQTMARERDALEDEARKWHVLHDQEADAARLREAELSARLREVEQELIRQQATAERAQQEVLAYRREIEAAAGPGAGDDWSAAYHALARSHQTLTEELDAKLRELRAQREETTRIGAAAEDRVRQADAQAVAERRAADESRRALSELEQAHLEVVRSLRELNDRYIRLRERYAGSIAPEAVERAAPAAPRAATPSAPPATPTGGPRIRLLR